MDKVGSQMGLVLHALAQHENDVASGQESANNIRMALKEPFLLLFACFRHLSVMVLSSRKIETQHCMMASSLEADVNTSLVKRDAKW